MLFDICHILSGNYGNLEYLFRLYRKEITMSVDRIDSNKGYTKDNIWIVHKDVNLIKQDYDIKYFISMCKAIANNNE